MHATNIKPESPTVPIRRKELMKKFQQTKQTSKQANKKIYSPKLKNKEEKLPKGLKGRGCNLTD